MHPLPVVASYAAKYRAAVDEFNRYNPNLQIVVEGEELRSRRYGGTFDADQPLALADFLRSEPDITIARDGEQMIIRAR